MMRRIRWQLQYLRLAPLMWQTDHGLVCFNYLGSGLVELSNGRRLSVMTLDQAREWAA